MKKAHLTQEQRYTISAMHRQGCTQKQIAKAIVKDKSVINRELKRNANSNMIMEKLEKGKNAAELAKTVTRLMFAYRNNVYTITGDNGTEFANHQTIAKN